MSEPIPPPTPNVEPASPQVVEKRVVEYRGAGVFRQFLLFIAGLLVGANGVYFWMQRDAAPVSLPAVAGLPVPESGARIINDPPGIAIPEAAEVDADGLAQPAPASAAIGDLPGGLLIPVQGITASQLDNTYADARGDNRIHDAIDIMAAAGTPVLAAADGTVAKLFDSKQGGTTLYQFDASGRFVYYYAHLQDYAPGIVEGKRIKRGEVIGHVGSSGNANADAPHLHFAIGRLGAEGEWWDSTPINPYPLLGGK
ncbi:MAG: M23 family metallopeptidase [Pseudomonadota bacterium]|nr:M23 family metallopeptidase [Pseudomonadota bacterium]